MVPEAAAGIGRVGYLIANSAAVDAVGGALITVLLGWAVQLFADRKRIAWRAYLDTRINLTPAQASRLRFHVYIDEPATQSSSEVELPWLALLRVRNAGFVPIRGADFHEALTFVFPGRVVRGAEVIDHSGAAQPALAEPPPAEHGQQAQRTKSVRSARVVAAGRGGARTGGRSGGAGTGGRGAAAGLGGVAHWMRGWVTGTRGDRATTPDGRAPTDQVQLGEGLLLNRRDRFTVMVVLSGTPTDIRRRIRQTGSLIGGRVVAEPPRRGPNTRSMLFGGSVALPLAGLLLGLLVSLSPPPGSQCTGGSLRVEGSTAFAPAAQQIAGQYTASCHAAHITVSATGSVAGLNALAAGGARNPGAAIAMSDGPVPSGHQYVSLSPTPIGVIIFTVVVNSGTHVATLTTPQIHGIFTGAYQDWKQLGGAPGPIRIVSRYPNSGSQRAFDTFVLGGAEPPPSSYDCTDKNLIPASPVVLCQEPSTQALLQMVASIPGAIGYAEASDAAGYTGQGAQPVDLNGMQGTFGNVGTGPRQYPFWTVEYLYTYGTPARSSLASKFIDHVQSSSTILRANDVTPCAGLMHTLCAPGAR